MRVVDFAVGRLATFFRGGLSINSGGVGRSGSPVGGLDFLSHLSLFITEHISTPNITIDICFTISRSGLCLFV